MTTEFESSKPIYMQIVDRIIIDILQGKQKQNEKLPSVRQMAVEMGVNPNTIQRAYGELERMNVVETRRGQGTFVLNNTDLLDELRYSMQKEVMEHFVIKMKEIGITEEQLVAQLQTYLNKED